jgi:RNA polymerase sigma-70 factor (ECF subfamily)
MTLTSRKKKCILGFGQDNESSYCTPVCPGYSFSSGCIYLQAVKFIFEEDRIKGSIIEEGKSVEDLIIENYKKLKNYCMSLTKSFHLGEDICHEVLLRALENKDKINPEKPVLAWLLKTAKNLFIDYYRKEKLSRITDLPDEFSSSSDDIASKIESLEILSLFAFASLTEQQRKAIHLVYIEGLDLNEAAKEMKLSYKGFYSLLKRAEKKLKEEIESFYHL